METRGLSVSRAFVCCSNIVFLMSGFVLMSLGVILLIDSERVLLSRLLGPWDASPDQPLFYYLAFAIVGVGFVIAITGILGCWASCLFDCCITATHIHFGGGCFGESGALSGMVQTRKIEKEEGKGRSRGHAPSPGTLYMTLIVMLLVGECAVCVIAGFWPHLLGVDVRSSRLVRALQRSYALPGREQFTAALDLAQTMFSCCGINGSSNYGTSWWRLQEVARRDLVVPFTCCTLNNSMENEAFLNPEPADLELCQTLNPAEHQRARHTVGCIGMIERWTQEQALILLAVGLVVVVVEMSALVSTFLACSKVSSAKRSESSNLRSSQTLGPFGDTGRDYGIAIENGVHSTGTTTFGGKS